MVEKLDPRGIAAIEAENPGYRVRIGDKGEIILDPVGNNTEEMREIKAKALAPAFSTRAEVLTDLASTESAA